MIEMMNSRNSNVGKLNERWLTYDGRMWGSLACFGKYPRARLEGAFSPGLATQTYDCQARKQRRVFNNQ